MSGSEQRRASGPPDPVAAYFKRDDEVKAFAARVEKAGGVKAWRHRHNEGGKAKP